jgi:hypothetical protein
MAGGAFASSSVVVRPGDVGTSWLASNRNGGSSAFVTGPATAPLGVGSLQFTTAGLSDASQLFNYSYIGTPLANFDALGYSTFRSSSSTNPPAQTIALALQVHVDGPGAGVSPTLIFEPIYQNAAIQLDTWQTWDAFQGGNAVWWSTRDLPDPSNPSGFIACNPNGLNAVTSACAGKQFIHLSSILAAFPSATIEGGIGPFVGSGWDKAFTGYTDALRIGVSRNTTTYDFEPKTALVVTGPDVTVVQGDAIPTLAPAYSGLVHGDNAASLSVQPTCATAATSGSPVDTYAITCSGGVSANYTLSYVPGTLHVVAAAATPTPEGTSIVLGETATPAREATPPPTSVIGDSSNGGDSTPLLALLICVAFATIGLLATEAQRRVIRR